MAEHLPHQLHSHAAKHIKPKAKGSTPLGEQQAQVREGRILTQLSREATATLGTHLAPKAATREQGLMSTPAAVPVSSAVLPTTD